MTRSKLGRLAAAAALAGAFVPWSVVDGHAQPRPSTTAMTCRDARAIVLGRGAAVLGTGGQTFDRFVRDRSFCAQTEATRTSFVPTRDDPRCFVGYRCVEPSFDDWVGD